MNRRGSVLVVDDERSQRKVLTMILRAEGYDVEEAGTAKEAMALVMRRPVDLVLTDLKIPDAEGLSLLDQLLKTTPPPCVVIMTAYGTIDSAVEAMKTGAFNYLTKPLGREALLITVKRAFEQIVLLEENRRLHQQLEEKFQLANLVGRHPRMQEISTLIRKVAPSQATVLIYGESGTGKELVARAIHAHSLRKHKPFLAINCASIPESLIENELFGHEKGAFTSAVGREIGLFEAADQGTILLDEVADLSLALQAKLLRVLQEKTIRRLGGRAEIPVDVRVLAATNKRLADEITRGRFREDLFYRLNVVTITLPPLRERTEDIPELVRFFLDRYGRRMGQPVKAIAPAALRALLAFPWPGNVRQLESVIERAVLLCGGDRIEPMDLPAEILVFPSQEGGGQAAVTFELPAEGFSLEQFERQLLLQAMEQSRWVAAKAARRLGLSYKTLQYRLEKFQITLPSSDVSNQEPPLPK